MAVWDCAEGVWGVVGVFGFGVWVVSLDLVLCKMMWIVCGCRVSMQVMDGYGDDMGVGRERKYDNSPSCCLGLFSTCSLSRSISRAMVSARVRFVTGGSSCMPPSSESESCS